MVSVEDFDPNKNFEVNPWMVYTGTVALYKNRGPALNTLMSNYGPAKLCELVDGKWVVRAYKPQHQLDFGERPCDVCSQRPLEAAHSYRQQYKRAPNSGPLYAHGHWVWKRSGSRITSPPELMFVCYSCKQALGV